MKNKLFVGFQKQISDFLPNGNFLFLHDAVPEIPEWRRPVVFDPHAHHLNPLAKVDYHYAVYFVSVIDTLFSRGENTLTKDTGLDFILEAILKKPPSLHALIPKPDKQSTSGHVWAYNKINRILASPILRRVFNPEANQFKLNAHRVVLAKLDRTDLEEFDALLLGLLLVGLYDGQIVVPDFGFYGRDAHTKLIRQNRLFAGLDYLDEVPLQLRKALLSITDKTAHLALYDDAALLARHDGLVPSTTGWNDFVETAMERQRS